MQKLKNIEETIVSILKEKQIGADLHCHFEGSLTYEDLRACAGNLHNSLIFDQQTWKYIQTTMASEEKTLANFFTRLTGRWIRLLAIVGFLKYDIPIEVTYTTCFTYVLTKLHSQGIGLVELMVSVYTLSSDGDLTNTPLPEAASLDEHDYIPQWNRLKNPPQLSAENLFLLFYQTIENHTLCVRKQCNTNVVVNDAQQKMIVGLKYMIRREKEIQFRNTNSDMLTAITPILSLAQANKIVGVDIAGNEYDELGTVNNYSRFLTALRKNGVPFTIHAGEISAHSSKKILGYQNLRDAVTYGAQRLGHAVRLFDHTTEMILLLKEVITKGIFIELNISSNIWTGAVSTDNVLEHPIIQTLNGNHPLFKSNPELFSAFNQQVLICDDDPAVVSQTTPALVKELAQVAFYTKKWRSSSIENLLKQQYTTALKAAFK